MAFLAFSGACNSGKTHRRPSEVCHELIQELAARGEHDLQELQLSGGLAEIFLQTFLR